MGALDPVAKEQPDFTPPVSVAVMSSEKLQSAMAFTSMNWPSQNRPPVGCEHLVVQPPVSADLQFRSHWMFASTVHVPEQLSSQSVVQSVAPG
jgi:hypothetical protein